MALTVKKDQSFAEFKQEVDDVVELIKMAVAEDDKQVALDLRNELIAAAKECRRGQVYRNLKDADQKLGCATAACVETGNIIRDKGWLA